MAVFPRDVTQWLDSIDSTQEPDLVSDTQVVLGKYANGGWVNGTEADVIALGSALQQSPPQPLGNLSPVQALALSSELYAAELLPGGDDPADIAAQLDSVHRSVTSLAREGDDVRPYNEMRQQAAFAAVRQLGGARMVGLPDWMELALGDTNSWTACNDIIERVELACRNTSAGRRWVYVYRLGFVVYKSA